MQKHYWFWQKKEKIHGGHIWPLGHWRLLRVASAQAVTTAVIAFGANYNKFDVRQAAVVNLYHLRVHTFLRKDGPVVKTRKYCKGCYLKMTKEKTVKNLAKKVTTFCADCKGMPLYCFDCFNSFHKIKNHKTMLQTTATYTLAVIFRRKFLIPAATTRYRSIYRWPCLSGHMWPPWHSIL